MSVIEKITDIMTAQKEVLVKREQEIDGVWLVVLSGEHGFFFGKPGVAKSMITEDMARYFPDFTYFFHLMGKHTVPDELFGPISISALRQDKFEYNTEAYLPTADFAFLDEGFKASGAILNTLLRIMNERKFRNGTKMFDVPLKSLFIASNEIPVEAELAALYDRILFRFNVEDLKHPEEFAELLRKEQDIINFLESAPVAEISGAEFLDARDAVNAVEVPKDVMSAIVDIRETLALDHGITASSRRWLKTLHGVRAHAFLKGKDQAEKEDLMPLQFMLWSQVAEIPKVKEVVWNIANPILYKLNSIKDTITLVLRDMNSALSKANGRPNEMPLVMAEYSTKLSEILKEVHRAEKEVPESQQKEFRPKFDMMEKVLNGQKVKLAHLAGGVNPESVGATILPWEPEKI